MGVSPRLHAPTAMLFSKSSKEVFQSNPSKFTKFQLLGLIDAFCHEKDRL